MKTYLIALVTLLAFSIPSISSAAVGRPGPYFSLFLGTSFARDTTVDVIDYAPPGSSFRDQVSFDPGIYTGGTGGYDFGFMRLEGELSYRNANIDSVSSSDGQFYRNLDGELGAFAGMFNVYFDMHNPSRVTPYLGGGIGFASLYLSDTYGYGNISGYSRLYDQSNDTVAAYQVGAGMDVAINSRYSLDIGYRYFITDKGKLDSDFATTNELRLESHNVLVGFKFKF